MKNLEYPPRGIDPILYSYLYRLVVNLSEMCTGYDKRMAELAALSKPPTDASAELKAKVEGLAATVSSLSDNISAIERTVSGIQGDITSIKGSVRNLSTDISDVSYKVEDLMDRIEALENA